MIGIKIVCNLGTETHKTSALTTNNNNIISPITIINPQQDTPKIRILMNFQRTNPIMRKYVIIFQILCHLVSLLLSIISIIILDTKDPHIFKNHNNQWDIVTNSYVYHMATLLYFVIFFIISILIEQFIEPEITSKLPTAANNIFITILPSYMWMCFMTAVMNIVPIRHYIIDWTRDSKLLLFAFAIVTQILSYAINRIAWRRTYTWNPFRFTLYVAFFALLCLLLSIHNSSIYLPLPTGMLIFFVGAK